MSLAITNSLGDEAANSATVTQPSAADIQPQKRDIGLGGILSDCDTPAIGIGGVHHLDFDSQHVDSHAYAPTYGSGYASSGSSYLSSGSGYLSSGLCKLYGGPITAHPFLYFCTFHISAFVSSHISCLRTVFGMNGSKWTIVVGRFTAVSHCHRIDLCAACSNSVVVGCFTGGAVRLCPTVRFPCTDAVRPRAHCKCNSDQFPFTLIVSFSFLILLVIFFCLSS